MMGVLFAAPHLSRGDQVNGNPPKDADVVAFFQSHREAFERLARMGMEDRGTVSHLSVDIVRRGRQKGSEWACPVFSDSWLRVILV